MTKQETCEERIDNQVESMLERLLPSIDEWTVEQCYEQLEEYGHAEHPDPNPWKGGKDELIELLKDYDVSDWHDVMEPEELQERVCQAINDEEIDGIEEWRLAAEESHREANYESVLGVEKKTVYRVCLSWGGPSSYVEIEYDSDGYVCGGSYLFQDWFGGARRNLSTDTAEELANVLGICVE